MSESEDEETQRLADLKKYLAEKKAELEEELDKLNGLMQVVDDLLASRSFKTGIEVMKRAEAEAVVQKLELTYKNTKLGEMEIYQTYAKVIPLPELRLSTKVSPFEAFLVRKVLEPMRERDMERVAKSELRPDQMFSYDFLEENGLLKAIILRNFRDKIRLKELVNSISWTFFRMAEKEQSTSSPKEGG